MTPLGQAARKRQKIEPETRAAVMAALLAGNPVNEVARKYNLPEGTVKAIKARTKGEKPITTPEQQVELGALILENLRENVKATASLARVVSEPEWIRAQSAAELAVLYGVLSDKGVRLLEALADRPGINPGDDPPPEPGA